MQNLNYCNVKYYTGNLILNGGALIDSSKAILLRYKYIPSNKNFQFEDTIPISQRGFFQFENDGVNDYLLKVIPKYDSISFAPTYYPNGIKWDDNNSKAIGPHLNSVLNIQLKGYRKPLGRFSISGKIKIDSSIIKAGYSAVGIHLLDNNNNPIDFVYARGANNFSFNNLVPGSYKIWIDQCGIFTDAKEVILSQNNQQVTDIVLTANSQGISYDRFVGVEKLEKDIEFQVYPNPFSDVLKFNVPDNSKLIVQDVMGRIVLEKRMKNEKFIEFETGEWQSGLYIITIQYENKLYRKKVLKP
jgi:uncharacterized protein YciU (UPF0263 family)